MAEVTNVYRSKEIVVKNLPPSISVAVLRGIFNKFGEIVQAEVVTYQGHSLGFGFIQFRYARAARIAISRVNKLLLRGNSIEVAASHSVPPKLEHTRDIFLNRKRVCCLRVLKITRDLKMSGLTANLLHDLVFKRMIYNTPSTLEAIFTSDMVMNLDENVIFEKLRNRKKC